MKNMYISILALMVLFLEMHSKELHPKKHLESSFNFSKPNIDFLSLEKTHDPEDAPSSKVPTSLNINASSSGNSTELYLEDTCPEFECLTAILLTAGEYRQMENGRIHAHVHDKILEKCEYLNLENEIAVCESKLFGSSNSSKKHDEILGTITVIGLSTSAVFIILHLVLFLIIPEMKNLPGCCLASLCVTLVLGYVHFLIATTVDHLSKTLCVGVAMCIYYFFMASFFWMNAIAFDVWRSLREATNHLRAVENKFPRKRFLLYSAYAWLTPMAFAILTHQIDSSDHIPQKYRPRFADSQGGWCWFRETHSLLLLFITPFAVLVGLNILFFGVSAYVIINASLRSSESNKKMMVQKFFTFLRLAFVVGLTWVSAFVVHFTESVPARYVFVILNAFQGLFIFLAFSLKTAFRKFLPCRNLRGYHRSSRVTEVSLGPNTSTCAL